MAMLWRWPLTPRAVAVGVTVGVLALTTGCGAEPTTAAGGSPGPGTHTMPDGTVMEGETHIHDDSHDHGSEEAGPSEAAAMVCAGQVVDDVSRIMGTSEPVEPTSAWEDPMFTCTFDLAAGPLVLRVHDADDRAAGMAHFQQLRLDHEDAQEIGGIYSLGLPAYEAGATVAFVRDGKTLEVDATGLRGGPFGKTADQSRAEVAYAVATSVLACWTEHA